MTTVLHIATRHRQGGAERNVEHAIGLELELGHEVHLATGAPIDRSRMPIGCVVHELEWLRRPLGPYDAVALSEARRLMQLVGPETVHTHQAKAGVVGRLAATRKHVVLHTVHMPSFGEGFGRASSMVFRRVEQLMARCTDVMAFVSREALASYERAGVVPRSVLFLPSPIDVEAFAAVREIRSPASIVLGVGALDPRKRWELVISALCDDLRELRFRLRIVGEGPEEPKLRRLINELDLAHAVDLIGFVPDVRGELRAASAFVLASRVEGVPQAAIQAAAAGVPVVATRAPGILEVPGVIVGDPMGRDLSRLVRDVVDSAPPEVDLRAFDQWRPASVRHQHEELWRRIDGLVESRRRSSPRVVAV